jgi:hypothetical protein
MKLKAARIRLSLVFMPLLALSGCLLENTNDIINAEYYGHNSFRLAYIGIWEDSDFEGL